MFSINPSDETALEANCEVLTRWLSELLPDDCAVAEKTDIDMNKSKSIFFIVSAFVRHLQKVGQIGLLPFFIN